MKNNTIILIVALIAIISVIFYFESTKPKISEGIIEADIEIEEILSEEIPITEETLIIDEFNESMQEEEKKRELTEEDLQRIEVKAAKFSRAKELVTPEGYINIDNITIKEHIGKSVILVDFWTYSCINCQRTFPYLTRWHEKYKDEGLVIIGVHTPEFGFERVYENVVSATKKYGIEYPVVQDNDYDTWRAYNNRYWPRKYVIDIDGFIVYDHIGEGAYTETEEYIQVLLKERAKILEIEEDISSETVSLGSEGALRFGFTPEIYFGFGFAKGQLGNIEGRKNSEVVEYTFPERKLKHMFYLDGSWKNKQDSMELTSDTGKIFLKYNAKEVNIVAGASVPTKVEVYLDEEMIKEITVEESDLYNLVLEEESGTHELELKTEKGLEAFTFTFG